MSSSSTQDQLLRARSLIEQKHYTEARSILVGIDNPTAREWVAKIDKLALGDPFQKSVQTNVKPAKPSLLQPAINIMTSNNWEIVAATQDSAQFKKRKGPNTWIAAFVIVVFSLLGTAVICAWIAASGFVNASLRDKGDGTLTLVSKFGTYDVTDLGYLDQWARSVKRGATYGASIGGGVVIFILTYALLYS